ncbi:CPBP family intramembrane glutamic endopeptidase [Haloferula sargassicola]|uniref:CAAX prenyl protease 2/Lysostaphin resistance protein A-like domain-containing protein n=1 Tax=Haloferula sargassicola TaxID=490096 RepID=A0ABP9UI95_9BACT
MKPGALSIYRDFHRRKVPVVAVIVLGIIWAIFEWGDPGEESSDDVVEAIARSADVSMTLGEQLGGWSRPVSWLLAEENRGETRAWVMDDLKREELLSLTDLDEFLTGRISKEDEDELLVRLSIRGEKPDAEEWAKLKEDYDGLALYSWEAAALEKLDGAPAWVGTTVARRAEMQRWMLFGTWGAAGATALAMVAGLFGLPAAWRGLRDARPPRLALRVVSWRWGLFAFFLSDLALGWMVGRAWDGVDAVASSSLLVEAAIDAAWRLGGAALLMVLVLPRFQDGWRVFGFDRQLGWKATLGMLGLLLVGSSVWYPLSLSWFPEAPALLFDEDGWGGLGYALLSGVVLAPLCEELVFRGCLFGTLWQRVGFWPATLASSLVFSAIHHYGVPGSVGVFAIGVAACVLFRHTRSLKGPILLHAAYNFLITLAVWPVYQAPYSL